MFFIYVVGLVALVSRGYGTEVFVEVRKDLGEGTYRVVDEFRYSKPFVRTSANVPRGGVKGFLWVANARQVPCSHPSHANASWIVFVLEPSGDKAVELFGAGCASLLVPLNPNNTHFLRISPLPTVLIDWTAIEFFLAQPPDETIIVHVRTSSTFEFTALAVCALGLVCLCASVCLTWLCCRRRRDTPSARDTLSRHGPAGGLQESIRRHIRQLQAEDPNQVQVPLGHALTKQLPTTRYKRRGHCDASCAVCMNDYTNREKVRTLTCGHFFHVACIDEWLINYSSLCPLCKKPAKDCPVESSFSISVQECEGIGSQLRRGGPNYGSMAEGTVI